MWLPHTGGYRLVVVHHKNARRKKWGPLKFDLPDEVADYFGPHIEWGHKWITTSPFLFVTNGGSKFTQSSFCWDFRTWINSNTGAAFGPQRLRHIFITERMDDDPAGPGPSHKGAAMVSCVTMDWLCGCASPLGLTHACLGFAGDGQQLGPVAQVL